VANLVFGVASTITAMVPFSVKDSLPLQICDLAWVFVAWALLTQRRLPTVLTYYWGLTLSVQALVQPTLTEPFPDLEFFVFWGKHVLIVWELCLTLVLRHARTVGVPKGRGADVRLAGRGAGPQCAADANYGYVGGKPSEAVLDVLGPWPLYVVAEMAIVAVGWALITVPWPGGRAPAAGSGDDEPSLSRSRRCRRRRGVADAYVDLVAHRRNAGPCGRNSIDACTCGGSANAAARRRR
jgi:hypothetical protein